MKCYLLVDFGSTFTKLTAVDLEKEDIISTSKAITTVDTDITEGYEKALGLLREQIGYDIEFKRVIACSSAAGGLKMAAIGLVEELTVEAAKRVCLGAGAKVELVLSHNINRAEIQSIIDKKIDIILLAGGTNGGNSECVIHNATQLGKSSIKTPIVYAGNKDAADAVSDILSASGKDYYICENVMPRLNVLNIESAKDKIKEIFVKNIIEAKGIKKIEKEIDQVILPTPNAVLLAAELLSKGFDDVVGLGDLMITDVGGATTDMYSMGYGFPKQSNVVLRGLDEPFAKRTVEGDLGMRYSALGIVDSMNQGEISHWNKQGIDIIQEAKSRRKNIEFIPSTQHDYIVEDIFASKCIDTATSRHVGILEGVYTPLGMMYYQVGKDLTASNYVIGTGGAVISSDNPIKMLKYVSQNLSKTVELRPINPKYLLDKDYIMSAMGLLSLEEPEIALKIMKRRIVEIREKE